MEKRRKLTKAERKAVFDKCGGHCGYCGVKLGERFYVDHMKAHVAGGACEMGNFMPACFACNSLKIFFSVEEFRREVERQVERADKYSVNYRTAKRFGLISETPKPVVFYFETFLQPSQLEPRTNEQKAVDPSSIIETISLNTFNLKDRD